MKRLGMNDRIELEDTCFKFCAALNRWERYLNELDADRDKWDSDEVHAIRAARESAITAEKAILRRCGYTKKETEIMLNDDKLTPVKFLNEALREYGLMD